MERLRRKKCRQQQQRWMLMWYDKSLILSHLQCMSIKIVSNGLLNKATPAKACHCHPTRTHLILYTPQTANSPSIPFTSFYVINIPANGPFNFYYCALQSCTIRQPLPFTIEFNLFEVRFIYQIYLICMKSLESTTTNNKPTSNNERQIHMHHGIYYRYYYYSMC